MHLRSLLGPEIAAPAELPDLKVSGLTADSRAVRPGYVFAALAGSRTDGARFIADAASRGSVAILAGTSAPLPEGLRLPVLRADEPRRALALMAARFHGAQPAIAVAVTGTSGKTSVAEFTRQIFAALGHKAASLGTIGVVKPDGAVYGSLTTPDPVTLHATLAGLAAEGITHLAFEASSHGLDQYRLDGVRLTAAAFTNLGRDHLDYHPTVEAYLAAKLRLLTELLAPGQTAVVFVDDGHDLRFGGPVRQVVEAVRGAGRRLVTVGLGTGDIHAHPGLASRFPQDVIVSYGGGRYTTELPLIGTYQRDNALVAAGLAIAAGCAPADVFAAFRGLKGVPGRLELVGRADGAPVLVDYAHKPDALDRVLAELRVQAEAQGGRVICVFGCGGDRDKGKRPIMGRISVEGAGVVIVTDDNPRSEDPARIRAEILAAAPGAIEIGDRREAIRRAISMARPGDVVVIAGKGHETGQIVGATVIPFSDQDEVRAALGIA